MDDEEQGWRRFRRTSFDSKAFTKRAKKAETATLRHARKFITKRLDNLQDVRRHIALWLTGVAVLILAVGVQMMWVQRSYTTTAFVSGGTYAEAALGPVKTLNPLYASTSAERSVVRLAFSSLFTYDTTGHLRGDAASSLSSNKQGNVYTVKLRPGITWQDDTRLTAEDVVFTVNLIKNPAARVAGRSQWQGVTAKVLDDTTIQFTLPAAFAAFPHSLTFPIIPEHILKNVDPESLRENAFSLQPIGSGPFQVTLVQGDATAKIINLTRFAQYFNGAAQLARFEVHAYPTQDAIIAALKAHQVTAAVDVNDVATTSHLVGYRAKYFSLHNGVYAFLNTSRGPLKDINVRRALQEGLDINKLRQAVGVEYHPLDTPFISGQVNGLDSVRVPGFDLKKAGNLLDKAGWKLGSDGVRKKKGQVLSISIASVNDPQFEKATDILTESWKSLGVSVQKTIANVDDPTNNFFQSVLQPRAYDVLVYELSIGADPDVYAFWHSSQRGPTGLNLSVYNNGVVDDTLGSARAQDNPLLRSLKYKTFAKQWVHDVPAIGLYQSSMAYIQNINSKAMEPMQVLISPYDRYADVTEWMTDRTSVYKTP